jgi:23S rRNA (uracil1939-C5)-methyltransferase
MRRTRQKHDPILNAEIIDAGAEGMAVAKTDKQVVFVPYVVPGDVIDIQITKKKKSYLFGRAIKIHTYSDKRTEAKCEHFGKCGGCKWQNMDYQHQLFYKQKQVVESLQRIGKVDCSDIMEIIPSDNTYYYRNKLEFTFSNKKWFDRTEDISDDPKLGSGLGFHLPGMFDKILDIQHCHLQDTFSDKIRNTIRKFTLDNDMPYYAVKTWEGFLRNLVIRNTTLNEWMLIVVFNHNDETNVPKLMDFIAVNLPEITSLYYVINEKKNDDISDQAPILYKGKPYITEELKPQDVDYAIKYQIGPQSFFQTNATQANKLYNVIMDFAELKGSELVYDLYTGTGSIANFIAHKADKVIGLEYIAAATLDAQENAKINNIENTEFYAGDILDTLSDDFIKFKGRPDVLITDPPRVGMHPKIVAKLLDVLPEKIIYISCNPATQARDLEVLSQKYTVEKIQPVDMFPQTAHVENVVLLKAMAEVVEETEEEETPQD